MSRLYFCLQLLLKRLTFRKPLRDAIRLEAKMQGIAEAELVQKALYAYISEARFDRVERLLESAHASAYQDRHEYQRDVQRVNSSHPAYPLSRLE